ncbi:MAG: hypothetical protein ACR2FO_09045, partial [Actinomycetota bacterium]
MRTTLTLDDDVAALLERVRKREKSNLKKVVNEALRRGLASVDTPQPTKPFKTNTVRLGGALIGNLDNVA